MKLFFIFLFFGVFASYAQIYSSQVWTEFGVKFKQNSKLDYGLDINTRFDNTGIGSFFPQVSVKYKVKKWFNASIAYRFTLDKDKFTNFQPENNIQVNTNFEKFLTKRIKTDFRIRYQYQYSVGRWSDNPGFEQSAGNVIRLRPEFSYDLKDNFLTPYINSELFYRMEANSSQFYKLRIGIGTDFETDEPVSMSVGYIYDRELNDRNRNPRIRHIITLSLKYKF